MARRERVTRLKSHNRRRNKNPKLSPFQREQKRAKLANQAPTLHSLQNEWKSIPRSQRLVSEFLMKQQANKEAKRLKQKQQEQEELQKGERMESSQKEMESKSTTQQKRSKKQLKSESMDCSKRSDSSAMSTYSQKSIKGTKSKDKSIKAKHEIAIESLNKEMLDSVAPVANYDDLILDPTQVIIARKKERKHKKKQEARREKVKSKLAEMESELSSLVQKQSQRKSKRNRNDDEVDRTEGKKKNTKEKLNEKKRRRVDEVFERIHNTMSKEVNEAGSATQTVELANLTDRSFHAHEQITSNEHANLHAISDINEPHDHNNSNNNTINKSSAKAKDFYELVDVVRYGERVEAPPVFDLVPNEHSAVTTLARKLEQQKSVNANIDKKNTHNNLSTTSLTRFDMLSSVGDSGIGSAKRLARLGLASTSAVTTNASQTSRHSQQSKSSSSSSMKNASNAKEMELLRERVLAAYERNKRSVLEERKGVDLKHVFPRFS